MRIDSHLKVFLFTNQLELLKKEKGFLKYVKVFAEVFTCYGQQLVGGKEINFFNDILFETDPLTISNEVKSFLRAMAKTILIFSAIIFTLPGLLLKALTFILDYRNTITRNQKILDIYKKMYAFGDKCKVPHTIKPKIFKISADKQKNSAFAQVAKDIQERHILPFLTNKDAAALAKTCKLNYELVVNDPNRHIKACEGFPELFVNKLGEKKIASLPFIEIKYGFEQIFTKRSNEYREADEAGHRIVNVYCYPELKTFISSESLNKHNIFQCRFPTGPGLILRLRDNTQNKEFFILVSKHNNRWAIIGDLVQGSNLLQVLNQMRYQENSPLINDYIDRLLSGKPCGKFDWHLNVGITPSMDLEQMHEGSQHCLNGITPVIQLAPIKAA